MPDSASPLPPQVSGNLESVIALHQREQSRVKGWERVLSEIGAFSARPLFLLLLLALVGAWVGFNLFGPGFGWHAFDPPPFALLALVISCAALLTTVVVLMAQQRQARLESHKAHLDLQISLLAEQKISKVIQMLQELRHDSPGVRDRPDDDATALQRPADAASVLSALEDMGASGKLEPGLKQ